MRVWGRRARSLCSLFFPRPDLEGGKQGLSPSLSLFLPLPVPPPTLAKRRALRRQTEETPLARHSARAGPRRPSQSGDAAALAPLAAAEVDAPRGETRLVEGALLGQEGCVCPQPTTVRGQHTQRAPSRPLTPSCSAPTLLPLPPLPPAQPPPRLRRPPLRRRGPARDERRAKLPRRMPPTRIKPKPLDPFTRTDWDSLMHLYDQTQLEPARAIAACDRRSRETECE
jgi:hypothetical protein